MNNKHLAAILVGFLAVMMAQGVVQARKSLAKINSDLQTAQQTALGMEQGLKTERSNLSQMEKSSESMMNFLNSWTAALTLIESQESGELNVTSRIKQSGLITLSQRFEIVTNKNDTVPRLIRAHVVFEGDYVKSLNWLGRVEEELPASRVTNLRIVRGETGNDIRMNLVLDLPLLKKDVLATP